MNFKSYPTKKGTPSRRARKAERNNVFRNNKSLRAKMNRERRALRVEA